MIRSMTGFGTATLEDGALSVRVEARSVNHRYLKVQLRLPRRLEALDPEIEALVQKHLRRGAVSLAVACEDPMAVVAGHIDEETVLRYRDQVVRLWNRLGRSEPAWVDPITPLLPLPGSVVTRGDDAIAGIAPELRELVLRAVAAALADLDRSRGLEGQDLARILAVHADAVTHFVDLVAERAPSVPRELRDRLVTRVRTLLQEAGSGDAIDAATLLRELSVLADRCDVTEELGRLRTHLDRLRAILAGGGETGRRLDFLLQEMLRETNTIGSKANDATIAHAVVEMKCELERLKEQVQNLE